MDEKEESSVALGSDSPLSTPSTPPRAAQASFTGAPRSARNLFGAFNSAASPPASSVFAPPSPATTSTASLSVRSPLSSLGSRMASPVPSSHSTYSNLAALMSPMASPLAPPPPAGSSPIGVPLDFEDEEDRQSWSIDRSLGQSTDSGSMSSGNDSVYLDVWNTPPSSLASSRSSRSSRAYGGIVGMPPLKGSPFNRKK
jgi:hypothetical protein